MRATFCPTYVCTALQLASTKMHCPPCKLLPPLACIVLMEATLRYRASQQSITSTVSFATIGHAASLATLAMPARTMAATPLVVAAHLIPPGPATALANPGARGDLLAPTVIDYPFFRTCNVMLANALVTLLNIAICLQWQSV
jgi:hypothetical protein